MAEKWSERRLAENEVVFRKFNQKVINDLKNVAEDDKTDGHNLLTQTDTPLHFYCECSDLNCRERIVVKPSEYEKLHQNTSQFIIKPGHQSPTIERVIKRTAKYEVVEKYMTPPADEETDELHETK